MTKEKQNNIPKAKYPWVWECESHTLIFGELAIAAFLAFLLTSAHAALIQMEVCVVLLPIVIHLLMRAMTFAGLYIILRIKTTPDEFLVYCNLTSNDGKLPSNTKVSKGSLSGVQRVELPDERIPGNITSAIIGGYPQLFDDMKNIPLRMDTATDDGLVYCLKTPTRKIVIPVTLKCSENKRRRFQAESRKLVNGEPHNFFKCCSTLQQQIAIAYMEYENQPTEESRKFLKGYGKELTKVMLEQHMEKELTDLIRKDLFSCVMLEEMYCISSDMGANVVSAYILSKLAGEDKKELDFAI